MMRRGGALSATAATYILLLFLLGDLGVALFQAPLAAYPKPTLSGLLGDLQGP